MKPYEKVIAALPLALCHAVQQLTPRDETLVDHSTALAYSALWWYTTQSHLCMHARQMQSDVIMHQWEMQSSDIALSAAHNVVVPNEHVSQGTVLMLYNLLNASVSRDAKNGVTLLPVGYGWEPMHRIADACEQIINDIDRAARADDITADDAAVLKHFVGVAWVVMGIFCLSGPTGFLEFMCGTQPGIVHLSHFRDIVSLDDHGTWAAECHPTQTISNSDELELISRISASCKVLLLKPHIEII